MEVFLSTVIKQLILAIHEYNKKVQFRNADDNHVVHSKGQVDALMNLLKEMGYPVTWGYGALWNIVKNKYVNGYGYISFPKNAKELKELGVFDILNFENEVYWFIDCNGVAIEPPKGR